MSKVELEQTRTTECGNMDSEQATQELNLNIKHQLKDIELPAQVGYEFEKGKYVFLLIIPNIFKKWKKKKNLKLWVMKKLI